MPQQQFLHLNLIIKKAVILSSVDSVLKICHQLLPLLSIICIAKREFLAHYTDSRQRGFCEKTLKCKKLLYSEIEQVMWDSIQFTFVNLFVPPFSLYSVLLLLLLCYKLISVLLVYLSPTQAELSK